MRPQQVPNGCSRLLLALLASCCPAFAGTISPNTWYEFGFDPNHSPFVAGCQPADASGVPCRPGIGTVNLDTPGWTFTSSTAVAFTTTDGFLEGDFFDVFDLGTLIGSSPAVSVSGHSCGLDPLVCVADTQMSHASFLLPAGSHSITVFAHSAQILGEGFSSSRRYLNHRAFSWSSAAWSGCGGESRRRSSDSASVAFARMVREAVIDHCSAPEYR
jgi:hypothetical protein